MSKCLKTFYGTGYLEAFIKKRKLEVLVIGKRLLKKRELVGGGGGGGVRVIEILNYNFLRLKTFIETKKT